MKKGDASRTSSCSTGPERRTGARRPDGAARSGTGRAEAGKAADAGFTLVELLIATVVLAIAVTFGIEGMQRMREATVLERSVRALVADVSVARSLAIQRRSTVAIVADEAARTYAIRDEGPDGTSPPDTVTVAYRGGDSDLPLDRLDIETAGDELEFDPRGILSVGTATVELERSGVGREVTVSALGRTSVADLP